jgi:hypothetical protein
MNAYLAENRYTIDSHCCCCCCLFILRVKVDSSLSLNASLKTSSYWSVAIDVISMNFWSIETIAFNNTKDHIKLLLSVGRRLIFYTNINKCVQFNSSDDMAIHINKHWWFSGRMLACHAGDPGPIPGQCTFFLISTCHSWDSFVSSKDNSKLRSNVYRECLFSAIKSQLSLSFIDACHKNFSWSLIIMSSRSYIVLDFSGYIVYSQTQTSMCQHDPWVFE